MGHVFGTSSQISKIADEIEQSRDSCFLESTTHRSREIIIVGSRLSVESYCANRFVGSHQYLPYLLSRATPLFILAMALILLHNSIKLTYTSVYWKVI